jgi:hypothetical protein
LCREHVLELGFQAGTPLYKQVPGTGYARHELTVKLADNADYKMVCDAFMKEIQTVYEGYRVSIERQHQTMQNWMQSSSTHGDRIETAIHRRILPILGALPRAD